MMVWEVGGFVSGRLKSSAWGDGVVRKLAEYIHTKDPTVRGWSCRSIYKMVQLYETYSSPSFTELIIKIRPRINPVEKVQNQKSQIMPIELAQLQSGSIVPIELAQIPPELFSTGWSNHQLIMNNCKTNEQRLFYMMYAGREHLEYKELERAIKTDAMSAVLGGKDVQSKVMQTKYPRAPLLFKDRISLDMLGLPFNFKETKLRKAIVSHMKERRSNENPSIGILLCKEANMEVVRFALNRSMSPTMVAQYKEQLQVGGVIQRSLVEFCKFIDESK